MNRDWEAEEAALRAKVTMTFEYLMGIGSADAMVETLRGKTAHYGVEEAQEAYHKARAELDAFLDDRRANDPEWRSENG